MGIVLELEFIKRNKLLKDGDILFFRGKGCIARAIKWAGGGIYSHVAMVDVNAKLIECIEFREWNGGRTINLDNYFPEFAGRIDVYRPCPHFEQIEFKKDINQIYSAKTFWISYNSREATQTLRKLTGLSYGWATIYRLMLYAFPFIRFFKKPSVNDESSIEQIKAGFVCSTAIAWTLRKVYTDPIKNLADYEISPSELSRSPLLQYLYTIA